MDAIGVTGKERIITDTNLLHSWLVEFMWSMTLWQKHGICISALNGDG